ncbi:UPL2 [Symbiodinium natans]|uniref:UPL2 protein n=1 Tax=Symbiodinium natans TaxID=878477 RepID=A0A812RIJ6_9DINO|nr:UPL2 [Symbiodinium natans]
MHPDFWHLLPSITQVPDGIEVDEWALRCPDIEAAIKCLFCFLLFWTAKESSERFSFEVADALPLRNAALDAIERNDSRLGTEIGTKVRGDALQDPLCRPTVPPELADLKTVMNSVLQDQWTTFALRVARGGRTRP